jgi:hypothetical protein
MNERKNTMKYKLRTEPIGRLRRTNTKSLILACLIVGVLVSLLSAPAQASQPSPLDRGGLPADTFSILLEGPYKQVPLGHGPDLGLATVDLSDGSFSTTKIFAVSGLPEDVIGLGNGHEESDRKLLRTVRWQFRRLRPPRVRDSDQVRLTFNLVATFYLDDLKVLTLSTEIYSIPNPAKSPWRGGKNSIG